MMMRAISQPCDDTTRVANTDLLKMFHTLMVSHPINLISPIMCKNDLLKTILVSSLSKNELYFLSIY